MEAGNLRHRIELQFESKTQDSTGDPVSDGWTTFATRWAFVKPLTGREVVQAQQIHAETTHSITLRYMNGINEAHRVLYEGRDFQILSVINVEERDKELILLAVESK